MRHLEEMLEKVEKALEETEGARILAFRLFAWWGCLGEFRRGFSGPGIAEDLLADPGNWVN